MEFQGGKRHKLSSAFDKGTKWYISLRTTHNLGEGGYSFIYRLTFVSKLPIPKSPEWAVTIRGHATGRGAFNLKKSESFLGLYEGICWFGVPEGF